MTPEEFQAWLNTPRCEECRRPLAEDGSCPTCIEVFAQRLLALTVSCPRCKAAINTPCVWGSTHNGGTIPASHTPRYTRSAKKAR